MSGQPEWLKEFVARVCECLVAVEALPPIGCHVHRDGDTWEVTVFVSPTEIVGGEHDGERISALFILDALALAPCFDIVESMSWQPHQLQEDDEIRSHFSTIGYVQSHHVWLRILADSPERYAPGRYANINERRLTDTWTGP